MTNDEHQLQSLISFDALQRFFSTTGLLVYVSDPDTDEILYINNNLKKHCNLDDSAVGKICWQTFRNDLKARCEACPIDKALRNSSEPVVWEVQNIFSGRSYRNISHMVSWKDGRVVCLHTLTDITDIRAAEANLKKRLEQQELMSTMAQSFISRTDTAALIDDALRMCGEFMDVSRVLLGKYKEETNLLDFIHEWVNPDQPLDLMHGAIFPFVEGSLIYDGLITDKAPYVAFDDVAGEPALIRFEQSGIIGFIDAPIMVNGKFWGLLGVDECMKSRAWTDSDIQLVSLIASLLSGLITRAATEEDFARMSSIVERSPQYIVYITPEGNFEYVNKGAAAMLGYTVEEMLKNGPTALLDKETFNHMHSVLIPSVRKEGQIEFEMPLIRKDGKRLLLAFSAFTADHASGGIGAIATDITQQRLLEQEVIAAKEQAEFSSRAKGDFLSRMSHEIRTPLNAIIGMTRIAKTSPDAERKEYCLDKIESASTHLLGVVNDILDMSKIEANKFELSFSEFDLEAMLIRAVNVINYRVEEKKQTLIVTLDKNLPAVIVSDEQRLAQVFANLLSNAAKFTPDHGVLALSVTAKSEDQGSCLLQVAIKDSGIGISAENQKRLFRSFEQADGGIARKFGGTGLGLAISKNIVEMLGGSIWVESEEGHGATFSFTFRASHGNTPQTASNPEVELSGLRVLAVEDTPEIRDFFRTVSDSMGISCDVAPDLGEALRMLEQNAAVPYDVLFIDWRMPGMNGLELAQTAKERYGVHSVVAIVATAEWEQVDSKDAENVDKCISKPLFSSLLADCIRQCIDANAYQRKSATASGMGDNAYSGRHILLVEDVEINREIIISLLEHTGINIDSAHNGREAYEKFQANPEKYDIIFMDIHMPEIDGYEATRRIREQAHPRGLSIPIIAMTADVFREDIEKCLAAGMNDHLGKPINLVEIQAKLDAYLAS